MMPVRLLRENPILTAGSIACLLVAVLLSSGCISPATLVGSTQGGTWSYSQCQLTVTGISPRATTLRGANDVDIKLEFPAGIPLTESECAEIRGSWSGGQCGIYAAVKAAEIRYVTDSNGGQWLNTQMFDDTYRTGSITKSHPASITWTAAMLPASLTFDFRHGGGLMDISMCTPAATPPAIVPGPSQSPSPSEPGITGGVTAGQPGMLETILAGFSNIISWLRGLFGL